VNHLCSARVVGQHGHEFAAVRFFAPQEDIQPSDWTKLLNRPSLVGPLYMFVVRELVVTTIQRQSPAVIRTGKPYTEMHILY
ncbi:hypothetical protein EV363DRAFT_1166031, partial [Boletus edulis]